LDSGKPVLAVAHAKAKDPIDKRGETKRRRRNLYRNLTNRDDLPEKLRKQALSAVLPSASYVN
jgi:nucleoside-triphosphatase THEP1